MSSSRSPANFFRSNRRSASGVVENPPHHVHRRGQSEAINSDPHPNNFLSASNFVTRSRSSTPSSSEAPAQMSVRGMERLEKRRTMEERNFMQSKARSQNLNPPVDLRLLDFVSPVDENLTCPICRCPFVDPIVLTECDHCFCRDCIRQTWTTNSAYSPLGPRGGCPTCRTPAKLGPRSSTSKILINILDDLVVKCPKSDEGCKAQIKRGEVQDHISIYCGFAVVECPAENCELSVRRKDAPQGCLHFPVSCLACHEEMQKCHIETHWRSKCPDREVVCGPCKARVYYRNLVEHNERLCPAVSIKCPGHNLGCTTRGKKQQTDNHAKTCTFAILAPVVAAQQERLDEQEAAQKQMSRKLEVLETGLSRMHNIMFPSVNDPDQNSADPSSIPLLQGHGDDGSNASFVEPASSGSIVIDLDDNDTPRQPRNYEHPIRPAPVAPGPRPEDIPAAYSPDFDLESPFPPPAANGPYVSPLHHMLSMHESLRDEMSRVNSALQELDGRHSMQILNENMRTREEITYMGAQVAGLSRQVHWLTSAQLQRQGRSATPGSAAGGGDIAAAGPSVGEAISSAVRAGQAIMNAGRESMPMRRGPSEEGRTKL